MNPITIGQSVEFFLETLAECSKEKLNLSDEMIEHYILEEFIVSVAGAFSNFTLERLYDEGIIDSNIKDKSRLLQSKVMELDNTNLWNVEAIKTSPEWAEVIQLSDEIKRLVTDKWTSEELVYLKTLK
ncbi:hypothetical protein HB822_06860 [Listeria innocua]|uniref:hypothetical protein n=1 Tax=Listeria innocua TaxID=1642 RepID=UPI0010D17C0D|nr:hypothetical protein [Listeria innocua]EAC9077707.1 hypothetical protein [Listeria monocytogenes]EHW9791089.1 hypothetical protein [Listeria innocua]MBC1393170.1 hypothetical protein [Listeria innocua]MBC1415915.1 hypothetical protein [Listeria innocua]HBM3444550.1 hypothetical protein [Listeria innocua]